MKKTLIALFAAIIGSTAVVSLMADDERGGHEASEHDESGWLFRFHDDDAETAGAYLKDPGFSLYQKECGESCHIAYPPDMLPNVSWQAMMASLDNHFGENAELDLETRAQIGNYLGRHAAGQASSTYGERMWRATRGMAAPHRITETDYFIGQHHEIPRNMVTDNPEVMSFSRCDACHGRAAEGSFAEREIRIPGYGRWDD